MPSIRVIARFRPINKTEHLEMQSQGWDEDYVVPFMIQDPNDDFEYKRAQRYDGYQRDTSLTTIMVMSTGNVNTNPKFTFDRILWWDTDQEFAFESIGKPACGDFVEGMNMTIFAYGQSGSGKSFTTFGQEPTADKPIPDVKLMGIIPRSVDYVFEWIERKRKSQALVKVETELRVYEIYIHNQIKDLLFPAKPGDKKLRIRDAPSRTFVEGLKGATVETVEDVLRQTAVAQANRTVTCTGLNAVSSRSHCIFEFLLKYQTSDSKSVSAKMNFADLAGSEKVGKTGATGQALKEAQAINGSLTVLGRCIAELVKGSKNPPFRETALAHCLKTSLSGNCKTTLVVAASPHRWNMTETISSFQFAARAKMIKTKAKKNTTMSPAQMRKEIKRLKAENKELKMKLQKGGHKGATVSGPEIKIVWDGAIPEEEKQRKKAAKELYNCSIQTLEGIGVEDINLNVEILEEPLYTAVLTILPDDQHDLVQCRKHRDTLFEHLKKETTGPFSGHKSIDKIDPLSIEAFEDTRVQLTEALEEIASLKKEDTQWKNMIIELRKKLEESQQKLLERETEIDSNKRLRGQAVWKDLLRRRKSNLIVSREPSIVSISGVNDSCSTFDVGAGISIDFQTEEVKSPGHSPSSSEVFVCQPKDRKPQPFSEAQAQGIPNANTDGEQEGKQNEFSALRFTDEVRNLRKSVLENATARRKRSEEHEKLMKQMYAQQEEIIRHTKMAEESSESKDASNTVNNLLDMMKKQAEETNEVTRKMQEYFLELGQLRVEALGSRAENENLHQSIKNKEKQIMDMRETIDALEDQLKGAETWRTQAQNAMNNLKASTNRLRFDDDYANAAEAMSKTIRSDKNPMSDVEMPSSVRGNDFKSMWGLLRKTINDKKITKEVSQAQNSVNQMHNLIDGIIAQRAYLRETTTRYMKEEVDEKEDRNRLLTMAFLDDYAATDVEDWSVDDVCEWLGNVQCGELEKHVERFRKHNVNGELLLALKKRELQKEYRMKKEEVEIFMDERAKLDDLDDESQYEDEYNPEDLASSMLETELERIQHLTVPKEITENVWSFLQFRENFPDIPKVILVKIFCLLEKEESAVVDLEDLARFLEACNEEPGMEPEEDCGLYSDMDESLIQFADYKTIFKKHAPFGINMHGAKKVIKRLRGCKEDDIRDNDLGVEFILELNCKEFQRLMKRCPRNAWSRLANFDPFELLYREVKKSGASRIIFRKYVEAFSAIGIPHSKDDIKRFFERMGLNTTRPTPYVNTFGQIVLWYLEQLENKTHKDDEEIVHFIEELYNRSEWKMEVDEDDAKSISSDYEQTLVGQNSLLPLPYGSHLTHSDSHPRSPVADIINSANARGPNPSSMGLGMPYMAMRQSANSNQMQRSQELQNKIVQAGPQMPTTKITLNNQKIVAVRHRLMKFAVFGSTNKRGFEGVNDHAFQFSSFKQNTNPAQACRLNATQAKEPSAWIPDIKNPNSDNTHHVITTLGPNPMDLYAVAMQGRGDKDEWVVSATILVSLDGVTWRHLPTVHTFSCTGRNSVVVYPLYTPARCKYVKLRIDKWHEAPALRWDCLAV